MTSIPFPHRISLIRTEIKGGGGRPKSKTIDSFVDARNNEIGCLASGSGTWDVLCVHFLRHHLGVGGEVRHLCCCIPKTGSAQKGSSALPLMTRLSPLGSWLPSGEGVYACNQARMTSGKSSSVAQLWPLLRAYLYFVWNVSSLCTHYI